MSLILKRIELSKTSTKNVFLIFCALFILLTPRINAQIISNNSAYISILGGTIVGLDSINNDNAATISNDGIISIATINNAGTTRGNGTYNIVGDFSNTGTFLSGTSSVNFYGTGQQTIVGNSDIEFHNISINNSFAISPQITLATNLTVKNNLTMTLGKTNLAGYTLSLGASAALPGTLSYTSGWLYGGTFTRWFDNATSTTIPSSVGHFPMGTSTIDYRPLWQGWSAALTAGGTISVVHNPIYPSHTNPTYYVDPTWAGGTLVQHISNSSWVVSTANGFTSSGSNISMRFGGTGFSPFLLVDLNISLATNTVGNFVAATSNNAPLEVNRNGLSTSNLSNTFYIGTVSNGTSPLPIELLYFDANCADRKVIITWATASENNNDFFTLERTQDGIIFQEIGTFQGAGNSSQTINYSYTDPDPLQGVNYYRLKQTDFNGMEEYFDVVSVDCFGNTFPYMTIYPNPAAGNITIELNTEVQDNESYIAFYDLGGKLIKKVKCEKQVNQLMHIDVNELESGCYIVRLFNHNDFSQNARFIKL
jgi:hypothetical protein